MMEHYDTVLQSIKTESQQECDEGEVPDPMEYEQKPIANNATCNDQSFRVPVSYSEGIEMKHPLGNDVGAANILQKSEESQCEVTDIKVEVENNEPDFEPEQIQETHEPCYNDREIKQESDPSDFTVPTEVTTIDANESEQANDEISSGGPEKLNEHVYADGVLFEVREVEDTNCQIAQNDPIPTPATDGQARVTAQRDIISSIQKLGQNKQFKCDQCAKSFCDKMELKIHKRNHQFTVCPVCKKTMRTDFVKRHIARVHPDDGILPKNRSFPCNECDRAFPNDVQLKNHQLSHKKQECLLCKKIVRSDYFKRHMDLNHPEEVNSSDGTSHPCDQCDMVLSNKYLLFFHKRSHQTEECPVCKETLRAGYMKIHIDMKHPDHSVLPGNASFKCDQCEKSFGYKAALTLHKRKHRLTECPICGKTFRTDCLRRHMDFNHPNEPTRSPADANTFETSPSNDSQGGTDRRPHPTENCAECGETFRSDYLKIHMALKHPDDSTLPEDRPFKCDQCDKTFSHKTQLRLHKRNHRIAECPVCNKSMRLDCVRLHVARMHSNNSSNASTQDGLS
uniref:C2H2-type domain-containing protein n=1 Tax=Anopheles dirus TaxID=7168 RepID=A0A182NYT4_9DIPT